MKRRLLNLVTAISLLATVTSLAVWARGMWVGELLYSHAVWDGADGLLHRRFCRVTTGGGNLDLYLVAGTTDRREFLRLFGLGTERRYERLTESERTEVGLRGATRVPFVFRHHARDAMGYLNNPSGPRLVWAGQSWHVVLPWWAVVLAALLLPAARGWRRLRRRFRRNDKACRACRYDLTGNESGVCPECGTPATISISG